MYSVGLFCRGADPITKKQWRIQCEKEKEREMERKG